MMPTFLWTDIMIWSLFALIIIGIRQIASDAQKRKQWREVFKSKTAMVSAIILLFYFSIALVDSIHFKVEPSAENTTNKELVSVLDMGLEHLILNVERTYSAPFALNEYSSSVVYDESGNVQQVYLPLKNVATHINMDQSLVVYDVLTQTGWAFLIALMAMATLILIHGYFRFKEVALRLSSSKVEGPPWLVAYITLFILIFIGTWFYLLSFDYHVLGTNKVGEDVLYQSLKSIRTGVLIGGLTTIVMLPLALVMGISAGYFKGWIDDVIQYLYTTLNSIPGVLLISAAVLMMQIYMSNNADQFNSLTERADLRLLFLCLILGVTSWTGL